MSHYPTTAELAAFRRSIRRPPSTGYSPFAPRKGATLREREEGIGYRALPGGFQPEYQPDASRVNVRREASALRSRAYRAIADSAWAYDPDWEDFGRYRETFCPEHTARMMRQIRIVARAVGVL